MALCQGYHTKCAGVLALHTHLSTVKSYGSTEAVLQGSLDSRASFVASPWSMRAVFHSSRA